MKIAIFIFGVSLFIFIKAMSISHSDDNNGETNLFTFGWNARIGKFPSVVSIQLKECGNNTHICSGTIVSSLLVVTAAECVSYFDSSFEIVKRNKDKLELIAGALDWSSPGEQAQIKKLFHYDIHPDYNYANRFEYNIAVIRVTEAFDFNSNVSSIPINMKTETPTSQCTFVGWRKRSESDDNNTISLNQLKIGAVNYGATLNAALDQPELLIKSPCEIDSGGPVICNKTLDAVLQSGTEDGMCPGDKYQPFRLNRYYNWLVSVGVPV